jgi:hypothetical protein
MKRNVEKIRRRQLSFPMWRYQRIVVSRYQCGECGQAVRHRRYTSSAYDCLCRACYQGSGDHVAISSNHDQECRSA